MMDDSLFLHLAVGLLSTLVAVGTYLWLRKHPSDLMSLVAPMVWVLTLTVGTVIADHFVGRHPITLVLMYVAIAASGCRLAVLMAPGRKTAWLSVCLIVSICLLAYVDLFDPLIDYLDSFTLTFVGVRLSLLRIFEVILISIGLMWVTRALQHSLAKWLRQIPNIDLSVREWLVQLSDLVLYFAVAVCILKLVGIDFTIFAVFSGALGVSIGMGLQKIASNYFSGLILLFEKTVKVGDMVELEGGPKGSIYRLDPRGAFMLCQDGSEVIIPNEEFITKRVTNWTFTDTLGKVSIPVGVAYGSDFELAHKILLDAAKNHPLCLTDPPPTCLLKEFSPYAVLFHLQFWVANIAPEADPTKSDVMFTILREFKVAGIEIPSMRYVPTRGKELALES